uniref:LysE/ArgO family amino acid transporter n=1 Tax=Nocardia cyriacigeorgica TaxID=135487 RepID=UPI002458EE57
PHAYIDTVLLLGTVATQRGSLRWIFGLGAMLASLTWFTTLGYGARHLAPILSRPTARRSAPRAASMIVSDLPRGRCRMRTSL